MADRKFRVVVAGAGVSGLFMAETLKRAGSDFAVYEKAGEGRSQRRAKLSSSPPTLPPSRRGRAHARESRPEIKDRGRRIRSSAGQSTGSSHTRKTPGPTRM